MQNICYLSRPGRLNWPVLLCILVLIMPYRFTVFEYLQDLYSDVLFLHCLSVALHSRSGRYRPGGAYVGLCPLIVILFRCRSQKAKSLVSCPLFNFSSHYFAVMCRRSIPGEIKACPMPCNKFKLVCVAISILVTRSSSRL